MAKQKHFSNISTPRPHIAEGVVVSTSGISIKKEEKTNVCHLKQTFSIDLFETGHIFGEMVVYDTLVLTHHLQIGDKIRVVVVLDNDEDGTFIE